jgi:hypothetical protein
LGRFESFPVGAAKYLIETVSTDTNRDAIVDPLVGAGLPGWQFNPSLAKTMNWYPAVMLRNTMLEITE